MHIYMGQNWKKKQEKSWNFFWEFPRISVLKGFVFIVAKRPLKLQKNNPIIITYKIISWKYIPYFSVLFEAVFNQF